VATRYVGLADFLLIAEQTLGIPAETLAHLTDLGLADSALNAPAAGFGSVELYEDCVAKAAVLCVRLIRNHPLPNGNKRVALECLREFLDLNGLIWIPTGVDDVVSTLVSVATREIGETDVADWLRAHTIEAGT
jgi:death-on-curing protein